MIILYHKDATKPEDCTFNQAISGYDEMVEVDDKLYLPTNLADRIADANKVGWIAVAEQYIARADRTDPDEEGDTQEIPRKVKELNLDMSSYISDSKKIERLEVRVAQLEKKVALEEK